MSDVFTVPLKHRIAGEANIEILRAEMLAGVRSPLALIRYAEQGREAEFGLRLDIDKKVFLDHLLDDRQERLLTRIAPDVAAILGRELRNVRQRVITTDRVETYQESSNRSINTVNAQGETVLPVIEENLAVGKREVQSGGVRVYSHVTEKPVEASVNVREEHVTIDRRLVNRPVDANTINVTREGVLDMTETSEIADG